MHILRSQKKCAGWNIGYDVIQHGIAATLKLPKKVCAKVWAMVPATGEYGELGAYCNIFKTESFNIPAGKMFPSVDIMYSLNADAVTYLCNNEHCRSDGHISFDVHVPDPTHELGPHRIFDRWRGLDQRKNKHLL